MTFNVALLKERFRSRLLERIDLLEHQLRTGFDADVSMRAFHSLAGVAGSVGYDEATLIAREGEALCAASPQSGELTSVLVRLRASVTEAAVDQPGTADCRSIRLN